MTVAALIEQGGRYLLVEEHTADGLRLNTPAGHLEPGEAPQDGAVREALEGINSFDLGGLMLSYSTTDHSGMDFTDLAIIDAAGKFRR